MVTMSSTIHEGKENFYYQFHRDLTPCLKECKLSPKKEEEIVTLLANRALHADTAKHYVKILGVTGVLKCSDKMNRSYFSPSEK